MNQRILILTCTFVCILSLLAAYPASAVPTEEYFWGELDGNGMLVDGSGGSGYPSTIENPYTGEWYPYNLGNDILWSQWFYDHPTVWGYYKVIDCSLRLVPSSVNAYAEVWINWSTPEWSPNADAPPYQAADDIFVEKELVYTYIYEPLEEGLIVHADITNFVIQGYNPEWISIDIFGQSFSMDGHIWHECLAQGATVPVPGAMWLLGSGLIGLIGFGRRLGR